MPEIRRRSQKEKEYTRKLEKYKKTGTLNNQQDIEKFEKSTGQKYKPNDTSWSDWEGSGDSGGDNLGLNQGKTVSEGQGPISTRASNEGNNGKVPILGSNNKGIGAQLDSPLFVKKGDPDRQETEQTDASRKILRDQLDAQNS